jgi:hypothetical protein
MSPETPATDPLAPAKAAIDAATAGAQALVNAYNNSMIVNYYAQFETWSGNYAIGKADLSTMPVPPMAYYVASDFQDPTTGAGATGPYGITPIYWPYPKQGLSPVTAALPIPAPPTPQVQPTFQGTVATGTKMNVPPGDQMPIGTKITSPDGSVWEKMASPTPFGMATYYSKVS